MIMASNIKPDRIKLFGALLDSGRVDSSVFAYSVMHNLYKAQDPSTPSDTKEAV